MNENLIARERYLEKIRPFIGKNVIKVLTGQRRVGKSGYYGSICATDFGLSAPPFSVQMMPLFTV